MSVVPPGNRPARGVKPLPGRTAPPMDPTRGAGEARRTVQTPPGGRRFKA
jgi:hypothetical protein